MRIITLFVWLTAILFSTLLFANTTEPSIVMQTNTFSPSHPECTKSSKVQTPKPDIIAAAPVEKAVTPVVMIPKAPIDSDKDGVIDTIDQCPNTPKGYKVDKNGCPRSVTLQIQFATAQSEILPSSDKDVAALSQFMLENPASTIVIIGHTDNVDKPKRNQQLSEARANALAKRLIQNGIGTERIKSFGKGMSEPVISNKTAAGKAKNRRIEIKIN